MTLTVGTRLGPYEILSLLGAGGMGEVYRARDTRLERTVAIKIVSATLTADPQLRERFEREARAISSLNHPHICALYDIGDASNGDVGASGTETMRYLVLEYIEGETLADRLTKGPLPLAEALRHAVEIGAAMDAAHRAGIVHRDLKPANVMLTTAGAKLLDFGLARSATPVVATSSLSMLPTTPPNVTAQGTIVGTFQYMAPEQIEGLEADVRTDIFAFGTVLFEMLTGRRAFEGNTRASLLGAILKDEPPPVSRLQPRAPAALDRIVSTCVAKDPDDRYQSARDMVRDLKWVASGAHDAAVTPPSGRRVSWHEAAITAVALVSLMAAAWLFLRQGDAASVAREPMQFIVPVPNDMSFGGPSSGGTGEVPQLAISPDARTLAFIAGTATEYRLWVRPLAEAAARPIEGTEGAAFPFWSPDNRFIGFVASGKLKRVAVAGGPPTTLWEISGAPVIRGATWSADNVILIGANGGVLRVSGAGGDPRPVTKTLEGEDAHRWPFFLPDGKHFLYTAVTGACCPATQVGTIKVGSLDGAPAIDILHSDSAAVFISGYLLFGRAESSGAGATLMAQRFSLETNMLSGEAFPVVDRIGLEGSRYISVSAAPDGTLVYAHGGSPNPQKLTWFDRSGRPLDTVAESAPDANVTLAFDERIAAVARRTGNPENLDIWKIDLLRNNLLSKVTDNMRQEGWPVFSPDAKRIVYGTAGEGLGGKPEKAALHQIVLNTGVDEVLLEAASTAERPCAPRQCTVQPTDWSVDGKFVLYTISGNFPVTLDIWALPMTGDRTPIPVARSSFRETLGTFSPNQRWVAFTTNEVLQPEVYVQPFPGPGAKHRISQQGGRNPHWRADGKELFYLAPDGTMMAVTVNQTGEFDAGTPTRLFAADAFGANQMYSVSADGQRFLVNTRPQAVAAGEALTVILNWPATIPKTP